MKTYLANARKTFDRLKIAPLHKVVSCTEDEIFILEQKLNKKFPKAYREFLLWMGHGAGSLFKGTHIFYEHLLNLQVWAVELLRENSFPLALPDDAVIILMHQGYQFLFLRVSEGDDPPLHYYNEGVVMHEFHVRYHNFDEFLTERIENEAKILLKRLKYGL